MALGEDLLRDLTVGVGPHVGHQPLLALANAALLRGRVVSGGAAAPGGGSGLGPARGRIQGLPPRTSHSLPGKHAKQIERFCIINPASLTLETLQYRTT